MKKVLLWVGVVVCIVGFVWSPDKQAGYLRTVLWLGWPFIGLALVVGYRMGQLSRDAERSR